MTRARPARTSARAWISPARSAISYESGTGRCGWKMGTMGRWTIEIQSEISLTLATVAERATSATSLGALTMISSQTVPRPSSPM